MKSRSREDYFRFPIKKRPTRKSLNPPLETWALVLVLIVIMVLSAVALGTLWDTLNADQAVGHYQDRLSIGFVS
jgi:hypothetical protein